jgi:hypothetical protein
VPDDLLEVLGSDVGQVRSTVGDEPGRIIEIIVRWRFETYFDDLADLLVAHFTVTENEELATEYGLGYTVPNLGSTTSSSATSAQRTPPVTMIRTWF